MAYGVMIESGAQPWQIFAQNEQGSADIRLAGRYACARLTEQPPFVAQPVDGKNVQVQARLVREDSGEVVLGWQPCTLLPDSRWETVLAQVPAGGLYRIETTLTYDGWDGYSITRGDMVHHVGVGDIFVVAGQSNACGRAKTPLEDAPELGVHLLRNSGRWDLAAHPMGETTGAVFTGHLENHNPGHNAFLQFGKLLKAALGYPIGIVMTSHGGTPFSWWNPDENGALFHNMAAMLAQLDVRPRAMLWYQGEAECYEDGSHDYLQRFTRFVQAVRGLPGLTGLPVFTVQLNRCTNDDDEVLDRHWGRVRQAQRDAMYQIEGVYTVPAGGLPLYDCAHLAPEGNLRLAGRLADAALANLYGKNRPWRAPEAARALLEADGAVRLEFENIHNWLDVYGLPPARLPIEAEDENGLQRADSYELLPAGLRLRFGRALLPGAVLHGAWRMDPGAEWPQDCGRMHMLAFYGLRICMESQSE